MRINILYEDKEVLVVYKPAGLAAQTARIGQPDVVSELKNHLKGGYVGVVHRLDQPVEGLLVFGKTKEAAADLSVQLNRGVLNKHYYAVVCGQPKNRNGRFMDYLTKTKDNLAQVVERGGKQAILEYKLQESISVAEKIVTAEKTDWENEKIFLADIHIQTGRFHQIRVQMSHGGLPLLGDLKYGTETSCQISRCLKVQNVALCACEISFEHPKTHKKMNFQIKPQGIIFSEFSIL